MSPEMYQKGIDEKNYSTLDLENMAQKYNWSVDPSTAINVKRDGFSSDMFGKYQDTGKEGSGQEKYLDKIVTAAKLNKIDPGKIVVVNYGKNDGALDVFLHLGDGIFVRCDKDLSDSGEERYNELWIPDGYTWNGYEIRKESYVKKP